MKLLNRLLDEAKKEYEQTKDSELLERIENLEEQLTAYESDLMDDIQFCE